MFLLFRKNNENHSAYSAKDFIPILRVAVFLIIPLNTSLISKNIHRRLERYSMLLQIDPVFMLVPYEGTLPLHIIHRKSIADTMRNLNIYFVCRKCPHAPPLCVLFLLTALLPLRIMIIRFS